jgi:serpin B
MCKYKILIISILVSFLRNAILAQPNPVTDGNNQFAFQLYAKIKDKGNLFYSPFSITTALAMTYAGAKGKTEEEMSKTLHFSPGQGIFHNFYKGLIDSIMSDTEDGVKLNVANSLWAGQSITFTPLFINYMEDYYRSEIKKEDFAKEEGRKKAVDDINAWVAAKTGDKIKDMVKDLDPSTRLLLINAIYFKGKWEYEFPVSRTKPDSFIVDNRTKIQVKYMHLNKPYPYYENSFLKAISIPYKGKKLSMIIFLPNHSGIKQLEDSLSDSFYSKVIHKLTLKEVVLSLPEFNMMKDFDLGKTLSEMGMPDAFNSNADFSAMSSEPLYIGKVLHKAYIDVSEEGTEAAAATVVTARVSMVMPMSVFDANHPFIFFITDNKTGRILFMGKVANPSLGITNPDIHRDEH